MLNVSNKLQNILNIAKNTLDLFQAEVKNLAFGISYTRVKGL